MSLKLNETPVKTSNNFLINNIEIDDLTLPKNLREFKNVNISSNNSVISQDTSEKSLTYGNGKELEENIFNNANSRLKIEPKDDKIRIIFDFDDENLELVNQIDIIGNQDTDIIIEYKSSTDKECFHNGIIRTIAKNNCKLNVVVINLLNKNSKNFEAIENELYDNSNVNYTIIDLGGNISVSNYYANLIGENANNDLRTIYLGKEKEIKDLNYIVHLRGKKSIAKIDVQGAIDDNCKKNFKGTIDFKTGCKKAKGSENEFCLLLSEKAKSIALPMLLCTEDDVEGEHSTASGKIDTKILFYLMSRGLSFKESVKLIVKSNFDAIIERINDNELKDKVIDVIDEKLK